MHDKEDQELLEKLRAKYARPEGVNTDGASPDFFARTPDTNAATALTMSGGDHANGNASARHVRSSSGQHIDAAMCLVCHGSGLRVEEYNHRRLEHFCDSCKGRGVVVTKNGVEVPDAPRASSARRSPADAPLPTTRGRCESRLSKISARIAAYEQERGKLTEGLHTLGEEEQALKKQVLIQIDAQLDSLNEMRDRVQQQLNNITATGHPAALVEELPE